MRELEHVLGQHGIDSAASFVSRLRIMGRRAVGNFLGDVAGFGDMLGGSAPRRAGDLRVAAAGGDMGLGTADEVARQLLLYADHIVFDNELSPKARHFLQELDRAKLQALKDRAIAELHPYIHQYFLLRPAWERGMASFAYGTESTHQENHPLAEKLLLTLGPQLQYYPGAQERDPWFQLQVGSRTYFANSKFQAMNPSVSSISPPYATTVRDMNRMAGTAFSAFGPRSSNEPGDPTELLNKDHELSGALIEFVSFEVERLERIARMCFDSESHLVTDSPNEWSMLQALSTSNESARSIPTNEAPAFTFEVTRELAFIDQIPLNLLLDLRDDFDDEFLRFRGALLKLCRIHESASPDKWAELAQRLAQEEIQPALASLALRISRSSEDYQNAFLGGLLAATLTGLVAFISDSVAPLLASLPMLQRVLSSAETYNASDDDPMYFLLQVRESSNS